MTPPNIWAWRSLVSRLIWDQEATGSSPVAQTTCYAGSFGYLLICMITARNVKAEMLHGNMVGQYAVLAQLVEYLPSKQRVAGSSPVYRSRA